MLSEVLNAGLRAGGALTQAFVSFLLTVAKPLNGLPLCSEESPNPPPGPQGSSLILCHLLPLPLPSFSSGHPEVVPTSRLFHLLDPLPGVSQLSPRGGTPSCCGLTATATSLGRPFWPKLDPLCPAFSLGTFVSRLCLPLGSKRPEEPVGLISFSSHSAQQNPAWSRHRKHVDGIRKGVHFLRHLSHWI